MNVLKNNGPQFTSRNKEIRIADDIMRHTLKQYPVRTTNRCEYYNVVHKDEQLLELRRKSYDKLWGLRYNRQGSNVEDIENQVMADIKQYKLGNCGELTLLAKKAFQVNGYDDLKLVRLYREFNPKNYPKYKLQSSLDHVFLLVNAGKDADLSNIKTFDKRAFIVDPWSNICDYVSVALAKLQGRFLKNTKYQDIMEQRFKLESDKYFNRDIVYKQRPDQLYPELKLKKSE